MDIYEWLIKILVLKLFTVFNTAEIQTAHLVRRTKIVGSSKNDFKNSPNLEKPICEQAMPASTFSQKV